MDRQCYAAFLGGCVGPLVPEHFISKSVLKLSGEPALRVTGHPWQREPTERVGIKGLASKVLCKGHNSVLSPVDTAGQDFFRGPVSIAEHQMEMEQKEPDRPKVERTALPGGRTFPGALLERWFLKAICGAWAAGYFATVSGWEDRLQPDRSLVEAVFGVSELEYPQGLYASQDGADSVELTGRFTGRCDVYLGEPGRVLALAFQLSGLTMVLSLANTAEEASGLPLSEAGYHPRSLTVAGLSASGSAAICDLQLDWGSRPAGKHTMHILGPPSPHPA